MSAREPFAQDGVVHIAINAAHPFSITYARLRPLIRTARKVVVNTCIESLDPSSWKNILPTTGALFTLLTDATQLRELVLMNVIINPTDEKFRKDIDISKISPTLKTLRIYYVDHQREETFMARRPEWRADTPDLVAILWSGVRTRAFWETMGSLMTTIGSLTLRYIAHGGPERIFSTMGREEDFMSYSSFLFSFLSAANLPHLESLTLGFTPFSGRGFDDTSFFQRVNQVIQNVQNLRLAFHHEYFCEPATGDVVGSLYHSFFTQCTNWGTKRSQSLTIEVPAHVLYDIWDHNTFLLQELGLVARHLPSQMVNTVRVAFDLGCDSQRQRGALAFDCLEVAKNSLVGISRKVEAMAFELTSWRLGLESNDNLAVEHGELLESFFKRIRKQWEVLSIPERVDTDGRRWEETMVLNGLRFLKLSHGRQKPRQRT